MIERSIVAWRPLSAISSTPKIWVIGGGVRRAAGVLEERREEQRLAIRLGQAERPGHAHREEARPERVAGELALGQVEGRRQGRQQAARLDRLAADERSPPEPGDADGTGSDSGRAVEIADDERVDRIADPIGAGVPWRR